MGVTFCINVYLPASGCSLGFGQFDCFEQKLALSVQGRVRRDYLPALRQWQGRTSAGIYPQLGDVVLVSEGPKAVGFGNVSSLSNLEMMVLSESSRS